jgi:uncharacterized protein
MRFLSLENLRLGAPRFAVTSRWPPLLATSATVVIIALSLFSGNVLVAAAQSLQGGSAATSGLPQAAIAVLFLLGMQTTCILLTLLAASWDGRLLGTRLALAPSAKGYRGYVEALLGAGLLIGAYTAIVYTAGFTDLVTDLKPFIQLLNSPAWLPAILAVAIGAPLSEELLFRGFLLPSLAQSRLRFRGAALLTTLAWTGLHAGYSAAGMVEVFLVGLYLSWLLWRTGSLYVPLACHAAINSVVVTALLVLPIKA